MSDDDEVAGQLVRAVFEFMEEIRPKGGVIGPPYVHRLGATHGPAFTIRDEFPRWEPPLSRFGVPVAPVEPFPVKGKVQEVPEAFRRRKPQVRPLSVIEVAGGTMAMASARSRRTEDIDGCGRCVNCGTNCEKSGGVTT